MNLQSIPRRSEHVAWSQIDQEAILLNLNNGFYYTLNEVGCDAWKLIDAQRPICAISDEIRSLYAVEQDQIVHDLCILFQELQQEDLIIILDSQPERHE
ncbi:hypothetical protein U27_03014 [Candidatus Vecturithrix granuli]|uniref:PqqD family protein n=1 Tax=Vecturithrix granuli TaxID=1499967 RepID=A0A081BUP7_VECG1|nr:hypothetical protein U27_03014 [Candidatus Vecturithrix granuli]